MDEDAMNCRIMVEDVDLPQQLDFGDGFVVVLKLADNVRLLGCFQFHADVGAAVRATSNLDDHQ